jgi:putative phosphoesterase
VTTLVGVIADTHVPQRLKCLPPGIAKVFDGVALILHVGDINSRCVLDELGRIAPVAAVAGNADLWLDLPRSRIVQVEGCRIGLTHGHGGWRRYFLDKFRDKLGHYDLARYLRYASEAFRDVDVVISGHTHRPHLAYVGKVLLFNPGAVAPDYYTTVGPTVGLLRVKAGVAWAELVRLGC